MAKHGGPRSVESGQMPPSSDPRPRVRFGPFELDADRRLLHRDGAPVPVPGKALEILAVLVRHRERIVGREELMEAAWPDTFVEESNLTQNVSLLRKALGEGARDPRWVVTVPGRGYRFVGHLRDPAGPREGGDPPPAGRPQAGPRLGAGLVVLALAAGGAWWTVRPEATGPATAAEAGADDEVAATGITRLAVLPFHDLGPVDEDDYLSVALADALIARLSRVESLKVRPTLSVLPWAGEGALDPGDAADRLEVDAVVTGTFQRADGQLRVSVQLVLPGSGAGTTSWAGRFEREASLRPEVEDAIAEELARALLPRLTPGVRQRLRTPVAADPEAREEILKARYLLARRDAVGFEGARRHLERAMTLDPAWPTAWEVLAETRVVEGFYAAGPRTPWESFAAAREAALHAVELDPASVVAHRVLAYLSLQLDLDPVEAKRRMRQTLELAPEDPRTLHWQGWVLLAGGDVEGGLESLAEARRLDPLSRIRTTALGMGHYYTGDAAGAESWMREALGLDPGFGRAWFDLGLVQEALGQPDEAARSLARAEELLGPIPDVVAARGHLAGRSGDAEGWQQSLARLRELEAEGYVDPFHFALLHTAAGETEAALSALERTVDERSVWPVELLWDPRLEPLRGEPRYRELAGRLTPPAGSGP